MFIHEDFKLPDHLVADLFHFDVLDQRWTEIDYQAVMSSKDRLRHVFRRNDDWPADDMSIDFNRNDLLMHEKEFHAREAFAYAVFDPSKDRYIGCVYINPTTADDYDCEVYFWVRDSEAHLDDDLFRITDKWLKSEWKFEHPAYPGRSINWDVWEKLSENDGV